MKNKMNALYKISFIFSLVCIPLLVAAIIIAYVFEKTGLSIIFSASGALLAFAGIILGLLSKPKANKTELKSVENSDCHRLS